MVKIYNGVVVYQNIGSVIIPDGEVDDLVVNNIATINTLHVSNTLGLSDVNLTHGTISSTPEETTDITNKDYVDSSISSISSVSLTTGTITKTASSNNDILNKKYFDDNRVGKKDTGNYAEIFNVYSGNEKNEASGVCSHAEGRRNIASGLCSHTEGSENKAIANCTHAGGWGTVADQNQMTAIGQYNVYNENNPSLNNNKIFVVGNGSPSLRSDAFVVKTNEINCNIPITLTSGTISTSPTNNNDIANKAYVDSAISQGIDPSQTLTLTNTSSLITEGDITTETLLKTLNSDSSTTISLNNKYTIQQSNNDPAGLFYCPYNNTIYTIKQDSINTAYLLSYNLSTNTTSTIQLKDNSNSIDVVFSLNGFYDRSGVIPPYIAISGRNAEGTISHFCYYNIKTSTLSQIWGSNIESPNIKISYDGWIYYYPAENVEQPFADLVIETIAEYYPNRTNHFINLGFRVNHLLPLETFDNYVIIISSSTVYLYQYDSSQGTFTQLDSYNTNESNIQKLIYNDEKNSCYIITSKKIIKVDVVNNELDVYTVYDNSSSNFNYRSGIVNFDGTLYVCSYYSSNSETNIEQYTKINNGSNIVLKLVSNKTLSSSKYIFNYNVITKNNEMYAVYRNAGNSNNYSVICEIDLNSNSVISNCQTSLNGIIGINKNTPSNIDTPPINMNDILTVGTFFNLMKNFKCSGAGNVMNMDYLINNTFINSSKFINSC